jgi:hypothetical protein
VDLRTFAVVRCITFSANAARNFNFFFEVKMTAPSQIWVQEVKMTAPSQIWVQEVKMTAPSQIRVQEVKMTAPMHRAKFGFRK